MPYGLDYTDVRYETDHDGNRLKATIPYTIFSALTEFWIAARRAQTAKIEAGARPGQYKGSLQAAQLPDEQPAETAETKSATSRHFPHDQHWQNLVARLPVDVEPAAPSTPEAVAAPIPEPADAPAPQQPVVGPSKKQKVGRVFYREFMAKPPAEVMALINKGTYFIRAWRIYRGLTLADAAELCGVDLTTIIWHENGRGAPKIRTLEKFAQAYDVPILQITPKPGTDDSPFEATQKRTAATPARTRAKSDDPPADPAPKKHAIAAPLAPADTTYPDGVLDSLLAGKSPLLAWRLYRRLSLNQLAEQYGGRPGNLKAMEEKSSLRSATIEKLCKVFHCKPEQLLLPVDLEARRESAGASSTASVASTAPAVVPAAPSGASSTRRAAPVAQPQSVIAAAFEHAQTIDPQAREARQHGRSKVDRLARMQRELSRL
ncbi:helix-turn-helix domain-containing protein [Paraburkholderia sp. CNPSo 3155]|uniref:helix-turn-helix transcriptional regulator n=1 Tax=Paraburkholderia atlantica TaxID=2654982 RepID=UPI00128BC784|nr:helix-turn-helix transcriptional regulator [Paraburkholderia atlantica]MPW11453.1 helix-turn-helix domain-containing protein [Paraburkholderia atlantica]